MAQQTKPDGDLMKIFSIIKTWLVGLKSDSVIIKAREESDRVRSGRDKEDVGKQGRAVRLELSEAFSSLVEQYARPPYDWRRKTVATNTGFAWTVNHSHQQAQGQELTDLDCVK